MGDHYKSNTKRKKYNDGERKSKASVKIGFQLDDEPENFEKI